MKQLAQKPWAWTLYEHEADLYLSVISGGMAQVDVNIQLTDAERAAWESDGEGGLKDLIYRMQRSPSAFQDRTVKLPKE